MSSVLNSTNICLRQLHLIGMQSGFFCSLTNTCTERNELVLHFLHYFEALLEYSYSTCHCKIHTFSLEITTFVYSDSKENTFNPIIRKESGN